MKSFSFNELKPINIRLKPVYSNSKKYFRGLYEVKSPTEPGTYITEMESYIIISC